MPTIHTIIDECNTCNVMTRLTPSFGLIFNNGNVNVRRPFIYACGRNLDCGGFVGCVFNSSSDFVNYIAANPQPFSYCYDSCINYSSDVPYQIDLIRIDLGSELLVLAGVGVIDILKGQSSGFIYDVDFTGLTSTSPNYIYQLRINDFCIGMSGYNGYTTTFQILNL